MTPIENSRPLTSSSAIHEPLSMPESAFSAPSESRATESPTLLPLSAGFMTHPFGKRAPSAPAEGLQPAWNSTDLATGSPANLRSAFAAGFTMHARLDRLPQPAYSNPAASSCPWSVPSSP